MTTLIINGVTSPNPIESLDIAVRDDLIVFVSHIRGVVLHRLK